MLKFLGSNFDIQNGETVEGKIQIDRFMYPIYFKRDVNRIEISFGFNKPIIAACKAMFAGIRWHGFDEKPRKIWTCAYNAHNLFQIAFMRGESVYKPFDKEWIDFTPSRKEVKKHQVEFAKHFLTRRFAVIAGEMGTGKTLAMIEAMEQSGISRWLWVGPSAALKSVQLEFKKWKSKVTPQFISYSSLRKWVEEYPENIPMPQGIIFDESQKIKSPNAQRSQAAFYIADRVRTEWQDKGAIALLSGSPAPKSPSDWWHQCEVAVPGFLKEGSVEAITQRMGLLEKGENPITKGVYEKLVAWKDDANKCNVCGKLKEDPAHDSEAAEFGTPNAHTYVPSTNEVELLNKRMQGLVWVRFKRDCTDLPEKIYSQIDCNPSDSILRSAKLITKVTPSAAKALILLRELSDGFQYQESKDGTMVKCDGCDGVKKISQLSYIGPEITESFLRSLGVSEEEIEANGCSQALIPNIHYSTYYASEQVTCPTCNGEGLVERFIREAIKIPCPKHDVVKDLLEEYEDVGRTVFFAGFTGSVDMVTEIVKQQKWNYIRVDGRGWESDIATDPIEMLDRFQNDKSIEKLAIIGHPGTAGTGLNLTASPMICYYSNDFNAESRIQSEDRIHRLGMDNNRGARIIDIFHLPVDRLVYDNLRMKRRLQSISMGEIDSKLNVRVV